MLPTTLAASQPAAGSNGRPDPLRVQAEQLEAFLFEAMLKAAGTGTPSPSGALESQFESLLRRERAEAVAGAARTGLAEAIYASLRRAEGN